MVNRPEYRLYRWAFGPWGMGLRPTRGAVLATFPRFKDMRESAIRRARIAGYMEPDDWQYLFDWAVIRSSGEVRDRQLNNQHPATPDKKKKRR